MSSKEFFDKVFVINLSRSTDRLARITENFKVANLGFERFEAVDGYNVKITNFMTGQVFNGDDVKRGLYNTNFINRYSPYIIDCALPGNQKYISYSRFLSRNQTAGEIGVSCSHLHIWHKIVREGYKRVLIFEDDASIQKDFLLELKKLTSSVDQKFDIMYLFRRYNIIASKHLYDNFLIKDKGQSCTHGYYLSNSGARKLLQYANGPGLFKTSAVDSFMRRLIKKEVLKSYVPLLDLVTTSGFSVIGTMRR